ncbi:hypothetical protein F5Y09DRAFT_328556 [Xylaria sp. FL1042]|nr:hypothetical protein F5Y09DRAFT_328556 [Xylaria sp. FL1042]
MAPQLFPQSTLVFDSRAQIIDNCEFIVSRDDEVLVITSKDPAEKLFKAYAVQGSEEAREVLLVSEPCESAQKAIESLHTKSSEAIHNYITLNGFSRPRDLKTACLETNLDDDDDAGSVISARSESSTAAVSEWGSSGDEAMVLKHASGANGSSKDRQRPSGRPAASAQESAAGEPRSRGPARDAFAPAPPRVYNVRPVRSRSPSIPYRPAPPLPPPSHPAHPGHPGHPGINGPPAPPPPAMRNMTMPPPPHPHPSAMAAVGPHPGRPQNTMNPAIPPPTQRLSYFGGPGLPVAKPILQRPQPPSRPSKPPGHNVNDSISGNASGHGNHPPRPVSVFHPHVRTHTVRITVHWLHHGQHRIIAQCQPTRESLQSAAVSDVRLNPGAFTSDNSHGSDSSKNKDGSGMTLRAHVRQAVFAGEPYDMRTFHGQDLTRLFHVMAADDSIPAFEVVVEELPRDFDDSEDDEARDRVSPALRRGSPFDY